MLRARQEDASLVVEIEDGAPAIPQEVLVRLSSAHHRVETDKRDIARVGLGLAISGQLVALHGGKMWIESGVRGDGEGNVYGFTLPLE